MTATQVAAEIERHRAFAAAWQDQFAAHRADMLNIAHSHPADCTTCKELAASMRYSRYAVRMLENGQRPLPSAAWASGQRAACDLHAGTRDLCTHH
jgi:hypothetical protein